MKAYALISLKKVIEKEFTAETSSPSFYKGIIQKITQQKSNFLIHYFNGGEQKITLSKRFTKIEINDDGVLILEQRRSLSRMWVRICIS